MSRYTTLGRLVALIGTKDATERALGIGRGSICHWEAGRFKPSASMRVRIRLAYHAARRIASWTVPS